MYIINLEPFLTEIMMIIFDNRKIKIFRPASKFDSQGSKESYYLMNWGEFKKTAAVDENESRDVKRTAIVNAALENYLQL